MVLDAKQRTLFRVNTGFTGCISSHSCGILGRLIARIPLCAHLHVLHPLP